MRKKILVNELLNRKNKKEDKYSVLGTEIKNRRVSLSKTLSTVSSDLCSKSYISKLENSKIIPNKACLMELCNKLDISKEKIKYLFSLEDVLYKCLEELFLNKHNYIDVKVDEGKGLFNYRYKLVCLIQDIAHFRIVEAKSKANELLKIVSSMRECDLYVFTLLDAIVDFYLKDYTSCITSINTLKKFFICPKIIKLMSAKYLFYSYYKINHSNTIDAYDSYFELISNIRNVSLMEEADYIFGIFLLKRKMLSRFIDVYHRVSYKSYKVSLSILSKLFIGRAVIKKHQIYDATPFVRNLCIKLFKFNEEIINYSFLDVDYDELVLDYFDLDNDKEKYNYIEKIAFKALEVTKEEYLISFFLKQFAVLSRRLMRYKAFTDIYFNLMEY